ncbi:M15 family metallopeptidase [Sphingomonas bacterium]|uniref:M15 family metallopeptidase n=1 Tax=Sphingomonas bacterium TaxID=1895847 RepID=UPI0020C5D756|nr:M15 family metallopeptidase [Sphingomonas bacterium]
MRTTRGGTAAVAALAAVAMPMATVVQTAPVSAARGDSMPGHLPYAETDAATLTTVPAGFAVGQPCRVRVAMLPDLMRLLEDEAAAGLGETLHAVSCFRSVAHQRAVFCRTAAGCADVQRRAVTVGPPGRSEHATGYAIDFAVRPARGCADVSDCIAETAAGRWLLANAPAYGFELSFPAGNAQGVAYEPWHWRWAGTSQDEPGAAEARATLAEARMHYPARPEEAGFALHATARAEPPGTVATPDL